jgi:hypothetical protein
VGERVGRAEAPGSHSARASSIQRWRSSGTNRSGPSRPPMRIEGMRPALAASYSQVRETPSRAATSAGLRRSGELICRLLMWLLTVSGPKRPTNLQERSRTSILRGHVQARSDRSESLSRRQQRRLATPYRDIFAAALDYCVRCGWLLVNPARRPHQQEHERQAHPAP